MMLFEEFFKKKKINLVALNEADPALFSEFKEHYEQMGEKSFDHTKKYWFNKLRRQFPAPVEVKAQKFKAENQIAEQTVADTLTEPTPRDAAPELSNVERPVNEQVASATAAPKLGFKPKFNSAVAPTPPADETPAPPAQNKEEQAAATPKKPGFKPRFKAGVTAAASTNEKNAEAAKTEETPAETAPVTPPKMGFTPRFKAGVTGTAKPAEESKEAVKPEGNAPKVPDQPSAETPKVTSPKIGFTPRFKAGVTQTKAPEEKAKEPIGQEETSKPISPEEKIEAQTDNPPPAKLGFKPRFKAGVTTSKPVEEQVAPIIATEEGELAAPAEPPTESAVGEPEPQATKPAYKPRFTPNMIKRKPPEEE